MHEIAQTIQRGSTQETSSLDTLLLVSKYTASRNALAALLRDEQRASKFMTHLLQQRYAWSEATDVVGGMDSKEVKERKKRNEQLDALLSQLQDLPVSPVVLQCYSSCLAASQRMPVVKEKTFQHYFDWLKAVLTRRAGDNPATDTGTAPSGRRAPPLGRSDGAHGTQCLAAVTEHFTDIQTLLVKGLTDVWSVIRKQCAAKLAGFAEHLPMALLQQLFRSLVETCKGPGSSWQEVEGALLGMNAIIRKFTWEALRGDDPDAGPPAAFLPLSPQGEAPGAPVAIPKALRAATPPATHVPHSMPAAPAPRPFSTKTARFRPQAESPVLSTSLGASADLSFARDPSHPGPPDLSLMSPPHVPRRRAFSDPWLQETGSKRRRAEKEMRKEVRSLKLLWFASEGERFDEDVMEARPVPATPCTSDVREGSMRYLRFGAHKFAYLPAYISDGLLPVLYKRLAHPQLSVREITSRVICNLLSRTRFSETIDCFKQSVRHLRRLQPIPPPSDPATPSTGTGLPARTSSSSSSLSTVGSYPHLPHLSRMPLLGAAEAEGFVKLVFMLIRKLPVDYLTDNWDKYAHVLDAYLAHPACTVRQVTSQIYYVLVMKDLDDQYMQLSHKVLTALVGDWDARGPASPTLPAAPPTSPAALRVDADAGPCQAMPAGAWQWQEGRLLAYELILEYLVDQHISITFRPPDQSPQRATPLRRTESGVASPFSRRATQSPESMMLWNKGPVAVGAQVSPGAIHPFSKRQSYCTLRQFMLPSKRLFCEPDQAEAASTIDRLHNWIDLTHAHARRSSSIDFLAFSESSSMGRTRPAREGVEGPLRTMLLQSLECGTQEQWELQRMAQQVVPLCVEVIFYYNVEILIAAIQDFLGGGGEGDASGVLQGCILLKHTTWKAVVVDYCVSNFLDPEGRSLWGGYTSDALVHAQKMVQQFRAAFVSLLSTVLKLCLGSTSPEVLLHTFEILIISSSYLNLFETEISASECSILSDPLLARGLRRGTLSGASGAEGPAEGGDAAPEAEDDPQALSWRESKPPPLDDDLRCMRSGPDLASPPHPGALSPSPQRAPRPDGFYIKMVLGCMLRTLEAGGEGPPRARQPQLSQMVQEMAKLFPDLVLQCTLPELMVLLPVVTACLPMRDEVHVQNQLLEALHRVFLFLQAHVEGTIAVWGGGAPEAPPSFTPFAFISDPTLSIPTITDTAVHATSQAMLQMALQTRHKLVTHGAGAAPVHHQPAADRRTPVVLSPDMASLCASDETIGWTQSSSSSSNGPESEGCGALPPLRYSYREQLPVPALPDLRPDDGPEVVVRSPNVGSPPLLPVGELQQQCERTLQQLCTLMRRKTLEMSITSRVMRVLRSMFMVLGDLRCLPAVLDCFGARITAERPAALQAGAGAAEPAGDAGDDSDSDWDDSDDSGDWDGGGGEFEALADELTEFVVELQAYFEGPFGRGASEDARAARAYLGLEAAPAAACTFKAAMELTGEQRLVLDWLCARAGGKWST